MANVVRESFGLALAVVATIQAQPAGDREYLTALVRLQSVNQMGTMMGDWCAERSPVETVGPAALQAWRQAMLLDEAERRLVALLGPAKAGAIGGTSTEHRQSFFARLDKEYPQPAKACRDLTATLFQMLDAKKMYPADYEVMGRHGIAPVASKAAPVAKASASKPAANRDVPREELQAAAGAGLKTADIYGVLHHGYNRTTISGLEFVEVVVFLLKNGMAYRRAVPPEGLDLEKSRRLEPTQWGEWRKQGDSFEVRWSESNWAKQAGALESAFPAATRFAGTYEYLGFSGSVAFGGVANRSTYVFRPDGRFQLLRFSQGSAGSLAAQGGFSSSATSVSSGKGTSSIASTSSTSAVNGPPVFNAPNMHVGSRSSKDDGADFRGSFTRDGYSLELRFDSGRREQTLLFPWGSKGIYVWMFGRTYSVPEKELKLDPGLHLIKAIQR